MKQLLIIITTLITLSSCSPSSCLYQDVTTGEYITVQSDRIEERINAGDTVILELKTGYYQKEQITVHAAYHGQALPEDKDSFWVSRIDSTPFYSSWRYAVATKLQEEDR